MRATHHGLSVATGVSVALAISLLSSCNSSKSRPNEKEVAAAEDEVYEAVVRDMVTPIDGQPYISQLVFSDTLLTEHAPGVEMRSCIESAGKHLHLEGSRSKPPYNSLADKVYRALTRSDYGGALRADTIQDFLEKSCMVGRLSQTFHTDLPRAFIADESVHFSDKNAEIVIDGSKSFEKLFPGASGIISFSHAGFDSTLNEAIVSVSFGFGGLCGIRYRYDLRRKSGRWDVVSKVMLWFVPRDLNIRPSSYNWRRSSCHRSWLTTKPVKYLVLKALCHMLRCVTLYPPFPLEDSMDEQRKYAILFAATILAARKLNEIGSKPCPARECAISDAISNAELILKRIDEPCPSSIGPGKS